MAYGTLTTNPFRSTRYRREILASGSAARRLVIALLLGGVDASEVRAGERARQVQLPPRADGGEGVSRRRGGERCVVERDDDASPGCGVSASRAGATASARCRRDCARSMTLRGSGPSAPEAVPAEATRRARQARGARRRTSRVLRDLPRDAPRCAQAFEDDGRRSLERLSLRVRGNQPGADDRPTLDTGQLHAASPSPRARCR